ncbi:MAG: hypothetical protein V4649_05945 [Bacteroidota bacterium]
MPWSKKSHSGSAKSTPKPRGKTGSFFPALLRESDLRDAKMTPVSLSSVRQLAADKEVKNKAGSRETDDKELLERSTIPQERSNISKKDHGPRGGKSSSGKRTVGHKHDDEEPGRSAGIQRKHGAAAQRDVSKSHRRH